MKSSKSAKRWTGSHAHALFALTFLFASISASASDEFWVRIHHAAADPAISALGVQDNLNDYGNMQWGRLSAAQVAELEAAGARITVEANPFVIDLGGELFDPAEASERFAGHEADPRGDFHLIQFDGPIRPEWLSAARSTGLQLAQSLHPFSYIVWADSGQIAAARSLGNVRFTGPMLPEWKVQPHLRDFDATPRDTMALASAHADQRELWSDLSRFGQVHAITPFNRHFSIVHMDLPGQDYLLAADHPAIYTVQYILPETGPRGEMSNQSVVGNYDGDGVVFPGYVDWLNSTGFDGSGIKVGIVDGGTNVTHVDLVDTIVPCLGSEGSCGGPSSGHGTHVAGGVAGTGASGETNAAGFLRGQGVAPGASLVIQRYNPFISGGGPGGMVPDGMLRIYKDSAESGALLTNNSWGPTTTPQGYDIATQQVDFISRDALPDVPGQQPVLAVWSIMNGNGDSGGACAPASQASPDEAKNLFAVGSTSLQTTGGAQESNIFRVSPNSAHGPACDGRQLPHIVAPGCRTDSTSPASGTTGWGLACGTSMASPVVSGAVAVWAEQYVGLTGTNPSPALVKAVFTAAAQDLVGNPNADGGTMGHRPDRFQGYGRLDLDLVMNHGVEVFTVDQEEVFTEAGQDWSIGLNAVDPTQPIRIMLAWTDAPGHAMGGTTPAWVNNLDLVVEAGGNTYLGNVIGSDGWSATGGDADDRNNLEGVFLSPSQHGGAVNVTVNAVDIAADALNPWDPEDPSQDFALACYNCIVGDPTFSINLSPSSIEMCIPEQGNADMPVNVNLGNIGVYAGTVDLSSSGEPANVSSAFDPASVVVPGSSVFTLTVDSSAQAGSSTISITGDDGEDVHSRDLELRLESFLDTAPSLSAPADGASDTSLTPAFSWSAIGDIEDYRIEVASDAAFSNVVIDESVTGTSFTPSSELATGTEYFWRVQGLNLCGGGESSDVFTFTTRLEPVAEFSAESFSFSISDNGSDSAVLDISNVGTGNLTFDIETDQLDSNGRDGHEPGLDEELSVPDFNLPGQGTSTATIEAGLATRGTVVGFSFEGTVTGISGLGTWASDMALTVTAPDGTSFSVGGFSTTNPPWDFQGGGSTSDGTYTSTHIGADVFGAEGVDDLGEWEFSFQHTWNDAMNWSDVTITLHKQPPPFCGDDVTNVDWMTVSPTSGSISAGDSQAVDIVVNAAGLSDGLYTGYICVTTNDPNAGLVGIPVELDVDGSPPPELPVADITPDQFELSLAQGQIASEILFVGNTGDAALDWDIDTAAAASGYGYQASAGQSFNAPIGFDRASGQQVQGQADARVDGVILGGPISGDWNEGFDDIDTLPGSGWSLINNSSPVGTSSWFQGNPAVFDAHQGAADSYIGANFNNTTGANTISNWLLTPEIDLDNGTEISFWTRTGAGSDFPDRLEVRLSTSGDSTNVGTTATSVGDFDELLLTINEGLTVGGYPESWTEYTIEIDGLTEATSGRVAMRYFVTDAGPSGNNSNYIGIDTFSVTQPDNGTPPVGCADPSVVDWLSVGTSSGTTQPGEVEEVAVDIDTAGLEPGDYAALICVSTNDPNAPLVEVPVAVNVGVPSDLPVAEVNPGSFSFQLESDSNSSDLLQISNIGDGTLTWDIETAEGVSSQFQRGGDIVTFLDIDFTPNPDFTGGSVQWFTGDTCDCDTAPFDFNPYTSPVQWFWPNNATQDAGGVTLDGGTTYAVLQPGDVVGSGSTFLVTTVVGATVNWRQSGGVEGYLGFQFENPDSGQVNYGYAHITTGDDTGHPMTIHGWAFNQAGDPITVAPLGEPAGCDSPASIPWLSVDPASGSTDGGETSDVMVDVDSTGLAPGQYQALLCISTNDETNELIEIPVSLQVLLDELFADRFESDQGNGRSDKH